MVFRFASVFADAKSSCLLDMIHIFKGVFGFSFGRCLCRIGWERCYSTNDASNKIWTMATINYHSLEKRLCQDKMSVHMNKSCEKLNDNKEQLKSTR
nr:hypothetical protein [Tanacetum cinerariifolium]